MPARSPAPAAKDVPDTTFEDAARRGGAGRIAGIDEVGRGPWAGPVVACAVVLGAIVPYGIDDSKRVTRKRRPALADLLRGAHEHGIGLASVDEIDAMGIRPATHLAMRRAVAALGSPPDHLLIDGNDRPPWATGPTQTIVRGDARALSIAAASIIAKVHRDALMADLARRHPAYGWDTNAGYGTPAHRAALAQHGVTQHHRRSFAPIRNMLGAVAP